MCMRLAMSCLTCLLSKTLEEGAEEGVGTEGGVTDGLESHNEGLLCHAECLHKNSEFLHSLVMETESLHALNKSGTLRALSGI